MVFCYKIITESPRRSRCTSPSKGSPIGFRVLDPDISSQFIWSYDYEEGKSVYNEIPQHDWRLLGALARKRQEQDERENLADHFRKMWLKEKEQRQMVEAETTEQYQRYLQNKRLQERSFQKYKRMQRDEEHQVRTGQLLDCIRYKEGRSADALAWRDDIKIRQIISKAMEDHARTTQAAERRAQRGVADDWRRRLEYGDSLRRSDDAGRRRTAMLKDASQRLSITNALTCWETSLVRREVAAIEAERRARLADQLAVKEARAWRVTYARDSRIQRARNIATITAQMRDAVRGRRNYFT